MAIKKLVCDRCGKEVTDRYDIESMLRGSAAWQAAQKSRGFEPRGLFPCEDFRNCGGEMVEENEKKSGGFFRRGGKSG